MCDEGLKVTGVGLSFGTVGIGLSEKRIQIQGNTARKYYKTSRERPKGIIAEGERRRWSSACQRLDGED